jgi:hypothetical protein
MMQFQEDSRFSMETARGILKGRSREISIGSKPLGGELSMSGQRFAYHFTDKIHGSSENF